jgi:hypothetical protein
MTHASPCQSPLVAAVQLVQLSTAASETIPLLEETRHLLVPLLEQIGHELSVGNVPLLPVHIAPETL